VYNNKNIMKKLKNKGSLIKDLFKNLNNTKSIPLIFTGTFLFLVVLCSFNIKDQSFCNYNDCLWSEQKDGYTVFCVRVKGYRSDYRRFTDDFPRHGYFDDYYCGSPREGYTKITKAEAHNLRK